MARILVATVPYEGGYVSPVKDASAPIRLYSDRWVEDDIAARFIGRVKRERLSKNQYRLWRREARNNLRKGRV